MNLTAVEHVLSEKLIELASFAGILMVGVVALIWIVGKKREATERLKAVVQGICVAVLGPTAFKWLYTLLLGVKKSLVLGAILAL
ncbi:MAG: hypothetical protein N2043_01925 [Ignavibacterium sp.]|nr:hypothetical protein [Ignavibacterium sp.]